MRLRTAFAIALACAASTPIGAAEPVAGAPVHYALGDPIFRQVADARAIPENIVSAIGQDRAGFLWIGGPDGVVRYDGYEFRSFRHDTEDPHSLAENHVRAILGTADGRTWIATGGGVSVFDPATDRFDNLYGADAAHPGGLSADDARDLAPDGDDHVWIATSKGLDRADIGTRAVEHVPVRPPGTDGALRDSVVALLVDRRGELWVGSSDGLALRHADGSIEAIVVPGTGTGAGQGERRSLGRLFEARDGTIWIGIGGGVLRRLDPAKRTAEPVDTGSSRVYAIAQPEPDTVWFGTISNGIEVRDAATGALRESYRHDASLGDSLASDNVRVLYVDRSGVVWIGTSGRGLSRYNPSDAAFRLLRGSPLRPEGLSDEEVNAVFESSDGLLWLGTHDHGADVFDAHRRVAHYAPGEAPDTLDNPNVRSVAETADGAIWLGTYAMLNRLDRRTGRIERVPLEPFRTAGVRVQHLLPSADGKVLWVGSTAGLSYLDLATRAWTVAQFDDGRPIKHDVTDLQFDREGRLWVATTSRVALLAPGATRFLELSNERNTGGTLPSGTALSVLEDRKGRIWIGMSAGLVRLVSMDGAGARFESIAPRLGMANTRCDNLLEDDQGRIWIEEKALFDPETFALRRFGPDEGAGRSIWHSTVLKTRSGQLVMGGTEGAFLVDPARLRDWTYAPPVVLTELRVDGKSVPPAARERLVLPPNTQSVAFEFSALDYSAPVRNRYAYRLLGFDADWTEVSSSRRSATYTALPPGDYTLELRGSNREGRWSTNVYALPLRAEPAFWQTLWFKLALALFLVGLTWPLYRVRLRVLAARQRELEQVVATRTVELSESEHRAREASEAKSVFLANMSHELRTPLNAVLGFARLMQRSQALPAGEREHLGIIERSGEHLLALINQVLSIAKIESGTMTLDLAPFDLRDLLDTIARMMRHRAEEKSLEFRVELDDGIPPSLMGDAGKLRQALINLLGNAVKFTHRGEVALRARWHDGRAAFEVADTGPGIAAEELPRLFQPFAQTETGRAAQEGTGLGLAITRRIVALMGGEIAVESRVGEGTVFRFDAALPACTEAPAAAAPPRVLRLAGAGAAPRIGVVDDTEENRVLLARLLEAVGFEVRSAQNGDEALSLWRGWAPQLMFLDLRMPVLDGREASRRIRADEAAGGRGRTALVALTASVFEAEAQSLRGDGFDEVIFKPYREEAIFAAMSRLLGVRFEHEAPGTHEPVGGGESASIVTTTVAPPGVAPCVLLADDDAVNRTVAASVLRDGGYRVLEAEDGEQALATLAGEPGVELVLLDVEMPRLGGVATVRRIRADARLRGLPVLALTAHDDPADIARLRAAGMDGHVQKPFEPAALLASVAQWRARARRAPEPRDAIA